MGINFHRQPSARHYLKSRVPVCCLKVHHIFALTVNMNNPFSNLKILTNKIILPTFHENLTSLREVAIDDYAKDGGPEEV